MLSFVFGSPHRAPDVLSGPPLPVNKGIASDEEVN